MGNLASTESRDLAYLSNPDEWRTWPYVPLKRRNPNGDNWPQVGVIADSAEYPFRVYLVNLFELGRVDMEKVPYIDYTSMAGIILDKWQVD